jgi:hypothetical protein
MDGIKEFMDEGAKLGYLWVEGFFEIGDPLFELSQKTSTDSRTEKTPTDVE